LGVRVGGAEVGGQVALAVGGADAAGEGLGREVGFASPGHTPRIRPTINTPASAPWVKAVSH
jgi:hypothetical protein